MQLTVSHYKMVKCSKIDTHNQLLNTKMFVVVGFIAAIALARCMGSTKESKPQAPELHVGATQHQFGVMSNEHRCSSQHQLSKM